MSIGLCIMKREDCEIGKYVSMSKLIVFLREKFDHREITQSELALRSGIPNSTLGRIMNGEVEEPKASQIAQIAMGLGMPFWKLMQIAGYTTDTPGNPSEEIQRIAVTLESQSGLMEMMDEAAELTPEDRDAVRVYMADLQRRRQARHRGQKKPRSAEVKK